MTVAVALPDVVTAVVVVDTGGVGPVVGGLVADGASVVEPPVDGADFDPAGDELQPTGTITSIVKAATVHRLFFSGIRRSYRERTGGDMA
jgi:hypothetical protein